MGKALVGGWTGALVPRRATDGSSTGGNCAYSPKDGPPSSSATASLTSVGPIVIVSSPILDPPTDPPTDGSKVVVPMDGSKVVSAMDGSMVVVAMDGISDGIREGTCDGSMDGS